MFNWLKRNFNWEFSTDPRSRDQTVTIFNQAYQVDGLKEALANNVYFFKKKFIESPKTEQRALYYAEAYQRLLAKMVAAHEEVLKRERIIKTRE